VFCFEILSQFQIIPKKMQLTNFGQTYELDFSNLMVRINFYEQSIGNIFLVDHLVRQNIICIYCYIIWWSPNQGFSPNFQFSNGHLLIIGFQKVMN